ncbi:MAG: M1 family aminopeptidase [Planctomycetota bacterium]
MSFLERGACGMSRDARTYRPQDSAGDCTVMVYFLLIFLLVQDRAPASPPRRDPSPELLAPGISWELAQSRAAQLSHITYDLHLRLEKGATSGEGSVRIGFEVASLASPVILDFAAHELFALEMNAQQVATSERRENHLVLPAGLLRPGLNRITATFRFRVGQSGAALTSFREEDKQAGGAGEYLYTLLVPADAHALFPCFDQPDLKGSFHLTLDLPSDWIAISNASVRDEDVVGERRLVEFRATPPISTYLMAFAAGPFVRLDGGEREGPVLYVRPAKETACETAELLSLHREAVDFMQRYFDFPFPFSKLEIVLVPGFPYRGMEHPGAIFYRESGLVFDHEPTEAELLRRQSVIFHEVAHQWFGNLTTMKWFDDLWLKEGFATFVAYRALADRRPQLQPWLRFLQTVKPAAYAVDATRGTTPVHQALANLADAKSAYGAIVYNKAPAVLRQLEYVLGPEDFREGVRRFLARHVFANATWRDLVSCFEDASGKDLSVWAGSWIETAGIPRVWAEWELGANGSIASLKMFQQSVQGEDMVWPLKLALLIAGEDGKRELVDVAFDTHETRVDSLAGRPAPRYVFPNGDDLAYGAFRIDARSLEVVRDGLPAIDDALLRMQLVAALWDMVRDAEVDPLAHLELLEKLLEKEVDPLTAGILLDQVAFACSDYLEGEARLRAGARFARFLTVRLARETPKPLALTYLQALLQLPADETTLSSLGGVLEGRCSYPSITLSAKERWDIVAALLVRRYPRAAELFQKERESDTSVDAARYAYVAGAALATPENKAAYFAGYTQANEPPEQWVEESLRAFNALGQEDLTAAYLEKGLAQVEWVKENRKIFFMPAWLDAFINGQKSREALAAVQRYLDAEPKPPPDIRLKVLQSIDRLERSVRVREKFKAE